MNAHIIRMLLLRCNAIPHSAMNVVYVHVVM